MDHATSSHFPDEVKHSPYLILCTAGPDDNPLSEGPAFGVDVGVTNLRLAFADSITMPPEVALILHLPPNPSTCVVSKASQNGYLSENSDVASNRRVLSYELS